MKKIFKMLQMFANLQMFAEVVNSTVDPSSGTNPLATEYDATFWDTVLIRLAEPKLVHDLFAQKVSIPSGNGKTVEWRRVDGLSTDPADNILTEGTPGDGQQMKITAITAKVKQYGNFIKFTDMLELTSKDSVMRIATQSCAAQMAGVSDKITRNRMHEATNSFCANNCTGLAAIEPTDTMQLDDLFKAAARLESNDAPTIDGFYVAIMHPLVAKDLMSKLSGTTAWVDVMKYANTENIINGEIGKIGKVRVVTTTNAKCYKANASGEGGLSGAKDGTVVFATIVIGNDAYGTTEITGGGAELITHGKGEIGGPLNQYSTVGWKQTKAAEILVDKYMVKIYSSASQASLITANN